MSAKCSICGKILKNAQGLRGHMNFKHKMCKQTPDVMSIQQEIETRKQKSQSHPNEIKTPQNNPYPPTYYPNTPTQQPKQTRPTQKVSEPSPKQTSPIQQPKQTRPTPQPKPPSRQTTYEPPPMSPPEQTSPVQIVPEPSHKSSVTQQPIGKTPITHQILPEMITPDQKEKKRKLRTNRCYVCKISSKWFPREGTSYCPVCETEYETSCGCPDCGAIIAPDAIRCPRCNTVLGEEDEGEKFLKCFKCNIKLEWADKFGVYFCMQCRFGYVNRRACPACSSEIDLTTTECYKCQKKLEIGEGEYIYPKCIGHDVEMDYNDDAGFSCPECMEGPDQEEEEEEEGEEEEEEDEEEEEEGESFIKCLSCGAEISEEDIYCPNCGMKLKKELVELPPPIIETFPKCGEEFDIPVVVDSEIVLECPRCGRIGKISNPYVDNSS